MLVPEAARPLRTSLRVLLTAAPAVAGGIRRELAGVADRWLRRAAASGCRRVLLGGSRTDGVGLPGARAERIASERIGRACGRERDTRRTDGSGHRCRNRDARAPRTPRQIPWYGSVYNHSFIVIPAVLSGCRILLFVARYRLDNSVTSSVTTAGRTRCWGCVQGSSTYLFRTGPIVARRSPFRENRAYSAVFSLTCARSA